MERAHMKVLFLHIGDMHITDHNGVNFFQIHKIVDTLNSVSEFDKIVLIVAGDIAQSGTSAQYYHAGHLIGKLIATIKRELGYKDKIDVLCVPGNHDLDHKGNPMTSEFLQGIRKVNSYDKHLPAELKKQDAFFNFAARNSCFEDKSVFCRRMLTYGDYTIEANLINRCFLNPGRR
jgi:putative metallophosphoesterase protein